MTTSNFLAVLSGSKILAKKGKKVIKRSDMDDINSINGILDTLLLGQIDLCILQGGLRSKRKMLSKIKDGRCYFENTLRNLRFDN